MSLPIQQDGESFFVTPEGSDDRVELDLSGYVPSDVLKSDYVPKAHFESEIKRRVGSATKGLVKREEILADETILDDVIGAHRDTLIERLGVKPTSEADLNRLRESIEKKEVLPLREQLEKLGGTVERLREKSFKADFGAAAREVGVDDDMAELVELWARNKVQFNEDADAFVVVNADGEPELTSADARGRKHPYMTVADLLREVESSGEKKAWFRARGKQGGDVRRGGSQTMTYEEFSKLSSSEQTALFHKDRNLWEEMMTQTRRAGEAALGF